MGDAFHCKRDTLKLAWTLCQEESLQKLLSCVYFGPFGKKKIGNFFKTLKPGLKQPRKLSCISYGSVVECTQMLALCPCWTPLIG